MIRARAGVSYALIEAMDDGHCGLPHEQLLTMAANLLGVPAAIIEGALERELQDGEVVTDTVDERTCIFFAGLHRAERAIAGRLRTLMSGSPPWPAIDADKAVPWVESRAGVTLAESQREVVRLALRSKVLVITGGPGVGKTTLVNSILKILMAKRLVVIVGQKKALAIAVKGKQTGRRWSKLGEWLHEPAR